jgi:hypothetical protein
MSGKFWLSMALSLSILVGCVDTEESNSQRIAAEQAIESEADAYVPQQSAESEKAKITIYAKELIRGGVLDGVFLDFGEYGNGVTDQFGMISMNLDVGKLVPFVAQKSGYMERHGNLFIEDNMSAELELTLIDLSHPDFDLHAYKKAVFDRQKAFPYHSKRWLTPPQLYVDMTPDEQTGESFTTAHVDALREKINSLVAILPSGILNGSQFDFGMTPPSINTIVFTIDSSIYSPAAAGGGVYVPGKVYAVDGRQEYQELIYRESRFVDDDHLFVHEFLHVLGLMHTNGVPSVVTGNSIYYENDIFMSETTLSRYDLMFIKLLYGRAPGVTTESDIDAAVEFDSIDFPFVCRGAFCRY